MGKEEKKRGYRSTFALSILVVLFVLVFYIPAMKGGFIWDDDDYVTKNENLKTWTGLKRIWLDIGATYQYYPMVHTSYWVEYHLWKYNAFGYHMVNILLHGFNAVMVFLILRKLGLWWALPSALVFAVHPVHVESVAWITERKNVLSGLFYLLSLMCYLHFREAAGGLQIADSKPEKKSCGKINRRSWMYYILALCFYICALFSKTITSSLPVIFLLIFWWKGRKIRWQDAALLIPFFILGGIMGSVTARMEKYQIGAMGAEWDWTFIQRCLIAGRALWFYAGKLLVPHPLIFIYPRWGIDSGEALQYIYPVGGLILFVILWTMRHKIGKGPLAAVLYFFITLFPALGFFNVYPMIYSYVADHFQYLASIGMIALYTGIAAFGLKRIFRDRAGMQNLAAGVLILCLGSLTWRQGQTYKNLETLWRTTISQNPGAWLAHNNLGTVLLDQGKTDEAIGHFTESISINPEYEIAYYNLGYSHLKKGDYEKGMVYYRKAIELNPKYTNAYINLGMAYDDLGEHEKAIENYQKAQRLKPESDAVYNCLGYAYLSIGALNEAIIHYKKCLELNPGHWEANYKLARALSEKGEMKSAIHYYTKAIEIDPGKANYYLNLAGAFLEMGMEKEAKETLEKALTLCPSDPWIPNKLSWMQATGKNVEIRDGGEAVRLAEIACRLSQNKEPTILDTLAAAYAEAGRFEEALQTATKALSLARQLKQEDLAREIEARIELFKTGKPFRE
jgi:tetratricopeptide (TPR) repeat protein